MIPINPADSVARQAKKSEKQMLARQVTANDRMEESLSQAFNPLAAEREQGRLDRFKTLDQRKKTEPGKEEKIQSVSQKAEEDLAKNYQRRNYELPFDRLIALLRNLRENASSEEILRQVLEEFEDVTLADEALEYLSRSTEGRLQEAVFRAKQLLLQEHEQRIRAGRNIDVAAKKFNKEGLGKNPSELRQLYRDITQNPKEHNALFSELANKYSYEKLKNVLAFLLRALGYDLKSKGPSIENAELIRLMTDCRNLQSILWVYLFFRQRMKLIKLLYSQKRLPFPKELTFEILAKEFVKLVEERYPSIMKLLRQADNIKLSDSEKIIILTQWRDAIRGLSPRLYKSIKHRQDLLLVLVEALEELEEKEEEEEDEE